MSGEPVVILAGEATVRLITAAAGLAEAPLGPYAIIGGVAVSCRLGQAHRATADLDAVVDDASPPPAIEVLSQLPTAEPDPDSPHRIVIEGIKVEIQGTEPFRPEELDGLTDKQTLYVGAHRYALESATPVTLLARDGDARATVPVATAGALVAMKLHAIQERRPVGGLDKRVSDAWDIYRLLLDLDRKGDVRRELAGLQPALRRAVSAALRQVFVQQSRRTAGWLRAGDEAMATVNSEELEALAQAVLATTD